MFQTPIVQQHPSTHKPFYTTNIYTPRNFVFGLDCPAYLSKPLRLLVFGEFEQRPLSPYIQNIHCTDFWTVFNQILQKANLIKI